MFLPVSDRQFPHVHAMNQMSNEQLAQACAVRGLSTGLEVVEADTFLEQAFSLKVEGVVLAQGTFKPGGVVQLEDHSNVAGFRRLMDHFAENAAGPVEIIVQRNNRACCLSSFVVQVQVTHLADLHHFLEPALLVPVTDAFVCLCPRLGS